MDRFVTKHQWGSENPGYPNTGSHPIGATEGITAHWEGATVGHERHEDCADRVREIERFHIHTRGWSGIAYNLLVCQHGYVFEGRGAGVRSAANGDTGPNQTHYAVCSLAGPGDPFTADERDGLLWAFGYLTREGDAGPERNGHSDHKATQCPGPERYRWVHRLPPGAGSESEEDDMTPEEARAETIAALRTDDTIRAPRHWPEGNPGTSVASALASTWQLAIDARAEARANNAAITALAGALESLAPGIAEKVAAAVKETLAESVVDVNVNVRNNTNQE